jgi:acetoin utilization deacetylase AcuC-like enzyme
MLNDQAVASDFLLKQKLAQKVAIIDLDVHQGNGTAAIFKGVDQVYTFSMHGKNNYPLHKEQSDRDIVLEDGTADDEYLSVLNAELKRIGDLVKPDFLFYQCGVDVMETDKLGRLSLSKKGCQIRDEMVFNFARTLRVPVVCTMGGGYSERVADIVDAHINTFRSAHSVLE